MVTTVTIITRTHHNNTGHALPAPGQAPRERREDLWKDQKLKYIKRTWGKIYSFLPWISDLKCSEMQSYTWIWEHRTNLVRRKNVDSCDFCLGQEEKSCEDATKRWVGQNYQAHGIDPWSHFCKNTAAILSSGPGVEASWAGTAENPRRAY